MNSLLLLLFAGDRQTFCRRCADIREQKPRSRAELKAHCYRRGRVLAAQAAATGIGVSGAASHLYLRRRQHMAAISSIQAAGGADRGKRARRRGSAAPAVVACSEDRDGALPKQMGWAERCGRRLGGGFSLPLSGPAPRGSASLRPAASAFLTPYLEVLARRSRQDWAGAPNPAPKRPKRGEIGDPRQESPWGAFSCALTGL